MRGPARPASIAPAMNVREAEHQDWSRSGSRWRPWPCRRASTPRTVSESGATLNYLAAPGEANAVTIGVSGLVYVVRDPGATLVDGDGAGGCQVIAARVECPAAGITDTTVNTRDGDDTATLSTPTDDLVLGGDGADLLRAGDGVDTIRGQQGTDTVQGGRRQRHPRWRDRGRQVRRRAGEGPGHLRGSHREARRHDQQQGG